MSVYRNTSERILESGIPQSPDRPLYERRVYHRYATRLGDRPQPVAGKRSAACAKQRCKACTVLSCGCECHGC